MSILENVFTHKMLIPLAHKLVLRNGSCGVAFKELNSINSEYPDVIGFGSWGHSVLVEVKVSRSDFLCDKKKEFRKDPSKGMGKYRMYMCPDGLIKIEDLPEGWGLIWVGKTVRCVHNPYNGYCIKTAPSIHEKELRHQGFKQNMIAEHALMYSALRRLHIKGHIESIYDKQYNYNHKD
ncbi:Phage protein [Pedobacter cryoconitis]|uniref:Phage protein n=1 Tax=Pedobacter cryoconitis TaxID=188932 RepID=A0A127VI30_9SPHI|nr:hypothetical protein [Pedobacter cryoconitis]AMQ00922.1 Phage protein [Pedobacter cryoconitis]